MSTLHIPGYITEISVVLTVKKSDGEYCRTTLFGSDRHSQLALKNSEALLLASIEQTLCTTNESEGEQS